jgi:hypothetical protein
MNASIKSLLGVPFGKITDGSVKIGITGLAAKGKDGQLRTYNKSTKEITVAPAEFSIGDFPAYIIPSADLVEGDLIIHDGVPKFFVGLDADGKNKVVVNLKTEQLETLVPAKSILGFNFHAKVVSLFGDAFTGLTGPTADGTSAINPQSLMLMAALGDGDLFSGDGDSMLPLLLMGGLGGGASPLGDIGKNPLLLMLLMGKM